MAKELFNSDFNTLPEQVQINKEDIKKLSDSSTAQTEQLQTLTTKVDTSTSNIASNTESIDSIKRSYLLKTDASNTYATKTELSHNYVSKEVYDNRFDTGVISLTAQGLNKIKALNDNPNQTIELYKHDDFLELAQQPSSNDLKLQINYNDLLLYDNIALQSNATIANYDNTDAHKTVWYTGQAIITLSTQSDGLFCIAYQYGNLLVLHLITTF